MNKKEKIIQSALLLFAKHGFTETSIDKIARHAGVSKGLTYTHFKNKDDLLKAVIEYSLTDMTAEMMAIKEMTITALLQNFFKSLRRDKGIIRLCLLLIIHPETPESVNRLIGEQKQELLQMLTNLLQKKYPQNSREEAKILLASLDGITIDYAVSPDNENLDTLENYFMKKY